MKLPSPVKLSWIASFTGTKLIGDSNFEATGINEIHMVETGDITFVDHPKYYDKALHSKASIVIIDKEVAAPTGKQLLLSTDPFRDYNKLVQHFRPFEPATKFVSESAKIGEGTVIQPGVFVGNHVVIGKNCIIHSNVSIYDYSVIGDNVVIHANTVIGADGLYFKRRADKLDKMFSCGRAVIENDVEIGALCTIDRGVSGDTVIGEGTKMDNHIHVGHDTVIGKRCLFAAQVGIAGVAHIEDEVILWGQVGVNKDLTIGKGAVVYAQSGVPSSLEGGKVYFGSPVQEARDYMKQIAYLKRMEELFKHENGTAE